VDAFANSNGLLPTMSAKWSPDGSRILFGSMRDGLPQIYVGDPTKPADAAVRVTSGTDRAIDATFTRDGKSILFIRDDKGNELFAIWRVSLDGTGLVNLTPSEGLRRSLPTLPEGKPRSMFFTEGRMAETGYRVLQGSLDGGDPRVVYTSSEVGGLFDVSADGSRALVSAYRSPNDAVVSEVDVATGQIHRLFPPDGKTAGLGTVSYSADGKQVFVTTDDGGESSVLLALEASSGKELARYRSDAPGMLAARPSPTGDRIAVRIDAGNHGEVRILNAHTLKLERAVKVPLGEVLLGSFRPDGRRFSLLISLPTQPPDVFEVNTATGDVRPLRADPRPGLDRLGPLDATIDTVKAFDGLTIPINRYQPKNDNGTKTALPTLVIFHGGPATSYAVRWSPYARFFVSLGYAVVEPNVRGSTGFGRAYAMADDRDKRADWLKDLETVNTWTKSQPWCDPERVIVWGQSYGGYTTLMALTRQPTAWSAGVDLYGPADLRKFMATTNAGIRRALTPEFGDPDKEADLLERFSPMRDVDKIVAPLFVYQGQNDPRVPRSEGDAIVHALRFRKIPVEYMVAPNEGHAVDHRENRIELLTRTARFLEDSTHTR
jgi:dipeptidyl aminopeptidase/acylaminoacyl peptidase